MCKYALISVYDKQNIRQVAESLLRQDYHIISTGGTYNTLVSDFPGANIHQVSEITGFPEILEGRVKTLHPRIFGGILCRRFVNQDVLDVDSFFIDVVVVNLYPFESQPGMEMIDIGGVSLLRAAAKNWHHVVVVSDPKDYSILVDSPVSKIGELDRYYLANKVFDITARYDSMIRNYFSRSFDLKYGLNPYQKNARITPPSGTTNPLQVLNGRPGYINILDALGAWQLVREARIALGGDKKVATSFKHTSPAGVGTDRPLTDHERRVWLVHPEDTLSEMSTAYIRARNGDPLSSFGDFVACSHTVDLSTAIQLRREVSDGVIAPGYDEAALNILRQKKNGNFIILKMDLFYNPTELGITQETRQVFGFELNQDRNHAEITKEMFSIQDPTLTNQEVEDLVLGNITLKYTQSNSVCFVFHGQVVGIGAGQQNRLDCVKIAAKKATTWFFRKCDQQAFDALNEGKRNKMKRQEIVNHVYKTIEPKVIKGPVMRDPGVILCSDAFFPFRDNIDYLDTMFCNGVTIVCQPGGSISDADVQKACNETNRKMLTTGVRLFTH